MKTAGTLTVLLVLLILSAAAQQQPEKITVALDARPADCVKSLEGAGQYLKGSQVVIRAKPVTNCMFVGWEIKQGMNFNYTSANPFTFYAEKDFIATAVFERLYEGPGGDVIPRVLINPSTNLSLPQGYAQEPVLARPGQKIRYVYPEEVVMADVKYVFLYAEAGGVRFEQPVVEITSPEKGVLNITGYYYTYVRFLGEYYPANQLVNVQAGNITVSDYERKIAAYFTVAGQKFPLTQKVPRQLLSLVKIEYVRQFKITLVSNGAEPYVTVNEKTLHLAPAASLWADEGTSLTITFPEKTGAYRLKNVYRHGLEAFGQAAVGTVTGPVTLVLEYEKIPNAEFLDIPVAGPLLYNVAEIGRMIVSVEGFPALMVGIASTLSAVAIPASAVAVATRVVRGKTSRYRGEPHTLQPLLLTEAEASKADSWDRYLRARGRISIPPEIASLFPKNSGSEGVEEREGLEPDSLEHELAAVLSNREEKLAELMDQLSREGGSIVTTPYLLCHVPWSPEVLEAFKQKNIRLKGDFGYVCFDREGLMLADMLERRMTAVVESPDIELGVMLCEKACENLGLKTARMADVSRTDIRKAAEEIRKTAAGAGAVIFTPTRAEAEKTTAMSSALTGIRHVVVSAKPSIPASVKLPRPSVREYIGIAAAVMAEKKLLHLLSMDDLTYLGDIAHSFRGMSTIRRAAEHLAKLAEKNKTFDIQQALRQVFRQELQDTFTPEELELIQRSETVEQLKTAYLSLVGQLKPGANAAVEFASLLERMRRLNMLVEEA